MKRTSVLLFDLGGCLVDTAGLDWLRSLLSDAAPGDAALDGQSIRDRWLRSPAVRSFELGRISPEAFAERFIAEWRLPTTPPAFLSDLSQWIRQPYDGAADLITRLRETHHVSCLSNCNELHWGKVAGFVEGFDSAFSSHLMGAIKPDKEAFEVVMETLHVEPDDIRFFDDSRANVEAAERLGISGFLVDGLADVRAALTAEGLL
ncbi:MAG: HAD-IA family hydrolase [Thermoleophilia bacterium]|nr:HAD-IA family hydrolase [Thermoleophilia bacterium]